MGGVGVSEGDGAGGLGSTGESIPHGASVSCRAITSHAQKHFIKLLLRGEEVPGKVAETGRGYTLSGGSEGLV